MVYSAPSGMAVYLDRDISGAGSADLVGGTSVQFALIHLTSLGGEVRPLEIGAEDHHLRAGWIAFGRNLTLIGGVGRDYWHRPIYLDFTDFRWVPEPNGLSSGTMFEIAGRLRWYLSPGTAGHVYVQGL